MASIPSILMVLLIWSQDHMAVQGNPATVFSSERGNATLPCGNMASLNCSCITWLKINSTTSVELVTLGKIKFKRLSLLPNCSLHITDITTKAAGLYTCQQYLTEVGSPHNTAKVHLTVLHVFASPNETEAGRPVTLSCIVHIADWYYREVQSIGIHLSLLDEQGNELKNNKNEERCLFRHVVSVELRDPNATHHQRTWTCQLIAGGQVQTSANYTIRVKGSSSTRLKPNSTRLSDPHSIGPPSVSPGVSLIAGVGASIGLVATLLMVIIIVVIRKRRTHAGREAIQLSTQGRTSVNLHSAPNFSAKEEEESAELHYAAFQPLSVTRAGPTAKQSEDNVVYSSIRQLSDDKDQNSSPEDPCDVYATVQKNDKTHN